MSFISPEVIPFIVGAGLFLGSVFAGIWKGKKEKQEEGTRSIPSAVLQDNYSMLMMSEQLRENREELRRVVSAVFSLINALDKVREDIKDVGDQLYRK